MSLSTEKNASLAFDTQVIRKSAAEYRVVARQINTLSTDIQRQLDELSQSGWTTGAGKAYADVIATSWADNIKKYTSLLETFSQSLEFAANEYEQLTESTLSTLKLPEA